MPVLRVYKNGVWEDVAGPSGHTHEISDITNFPSSLPSDVEELRAQVEKALEGSNSVSYEPQELTDEQQAQARENIGFTEENAFALVSDAGLIEPLVNNDGSMFTNEDNKIFII